MRRLPLRLPPNGADPVDPQSFDHLPARYDRYSELVDAEVRAWLTFHLPSAGQTGRALDAGCGTGATTVLLADRFNEVLAVDTSPPMIAYAEARRPRGNARYEVRDLRTVTADTDGRFDVIVCAYTLHHLGDITAALWHLRSLLRPGGTALLVDVTDEQGSPRRGRLRRQAWSRFAADLRHGRPLAEAVELLRLSLDRDWLDHQTTDRLLPPTDWHLAVASVFPGATGFVFGRAHAMACTRPPGAADTRPAGGTRW
jgi:SAM-dependent methyltransferase